MTLCFDGEFTNVTKNNMAQLCLCENELRTRSIGKVESAGAERLDKLVFAWNKFAPIFDCKYVIESVSAK